MAQSVARVAGKKKPRRLAAPRPRCRRWVSRRWLLPEWDTEAIQEDHENEQAQYSRAVASRLVGPSVMVSWSQKVAGNFSHGTLTLFPVGPSFRPPPPPPEAAAAGPDA